MRNEITMLASNTPGEELIHPILNLVRAIRFEIIVIIMENCERRFPLKIKISLE
jgi:hypothetical protein